MAWLDDVSGDAAGILAEQGETVTHTPDGGVGVEVTAVWDVVSVSEEPHDDGRQRVTRGVLQLAADTDDVTTASGFTVRSVDYEVEDVTFVNFLLQVQLVRYEKLRVGGANSRIQR